MIRVIRVTSGWVLERFQVQKEVVERSEEAWAVYSDERLAFVAGVVRLTLGGSARLWLKPVEMDMQVLRAAREMLKECQRRFHHLVAWTAPGRDTRFAEWCGMRSVLEENGQMRMETWQ